MAEFPQRDPQIASRAIRCYLPDPAPLDNAPSAIPPSPGQLSHAEFADEIESGALRHLGTFGDHRRRHDRPRQDELDGRRKAARRPAAVQASRHLFPRLRQSSNFLNAGFRRGRHCIEEGEQSGHRVVGPAPFPRHRLQPDIEAEQV